MTIITLVSSPRIIKELEFRDPLLKVDGMEKLDETERLTNLHVAMFREQLDKIRFPEGKASPKYF